MIIQSNPVELTKIHYFNDEIPTISREIYENRFNDNVIVKKNIFHRHRWVLKINEISNEPRKIEKFQWRLAVCLLVLICLIVGVVFGVCSKSVKRAEFGTVFTFVEDGNEEGGTEVATVTVATTTMTIPVQYCNDCTSRDHICLKLSEIEIPRCVEPIDGKDPTGCGGFCSINTQFCQLLDERNHIYQCSNLKNVLKCPQKMYSCGNMCINETKRCDGVVDCSNKSDESNCACDLDSHFRCANMTSCIPKSKKCDGFVDCWDKSDEIDCSKSCQNGTIPCSNGDCIAKENFCDGKYHCSDKSDEPQGCQL